MSNKSATSEPTVGLYRTSASSWFIRTGIEADSARTEVCKSVLIITSDVSPATTAWSYSSVTAESGAVPDTSPVIVLLLMCSCPGLPRVMSRVVFPSCVTLNSWSVRVI